MEVDGKAWDVQNVLKMCKSKEILDKVKCFMMRYAILPGTVEKNKEAAAIENSGQGKRAKEKANFKRSETGIIPERIVTVEVSKNEKVFTGWKSGRVDKKESDLVSWHERQMGEA